MDASHSELPRAGGQRGRGVVVVWWLIELVPARGDAIDATPTRALEFGTVSPDVGNSAATMSAATADRSHLFLLGTGVAHREWACSRLATPRGCIRRQAGLDSASRSGWVSRVTGLCIEYSQPRSGPRWRTLFSANSALRCPPCSQLTQSTEPEQRNCDGEVSCWSRRKRGYMPGYPKPWARVS